MTIIRGGIDKGMGETFAENIPGKSSDREFWVALIGILFKVQLIGRNFQCPKGGTDSLANKANLVHRFILSIFSSTCFGRLCTHHQEKQLCLCDAWYLLCVDDWYVGAYAPAYHSSTQSNKYQMSHKHSCFS